ncbi:hypothetical protein K461DRAFT_258620 [Myriangium duriaei CBS 260.36]|uniref:CENP-V/GFA domain-containing protein n=1 Tax=Myriangium duriaei CBS 260.36 TaxID=1168546 RepID=A0A9P4J1A2_9PEZI|nr:hypothetical protein K461DRAFT_258620 [Myriangium duriaei CBS 260.36]
MVSGSRSDSSSPYIPNNSLSDERYSKNNEATATCFCGAVQLAFPLSEPGLVGTFICHCADCRKITASMFASNFIVADSHLKHVRGQSNLSSWGQDKTVASGGKMTNYFCKTCGTLMYRVGEKFPGRSILRIGTVDDFHLHETVLKPSVELFSEERVAWLAGAEGVEKDEGMGRFKA